MTTIPLALLTNPLQEGHWYWSKYEQRMYVHPRTSVRFWELFIPCVAQGYTPAQLDRAAQLAAESYRDGPEPLGAWRALSLACGGV